jgi:hypothetical protein
MLPLSLLLVSQGPSFAPPTLWAAGFAAPPRIPLVGDVDNDGYADLICVYPPGGAIIDVSLNQKGQKAGVPFQALNPWGKDCQAAVAGEFDDKPGTDVAGLFDGDTIRLAHGFEKGKFKDNATWIKLPKRLDTPRLAITSTGLLAWSGKDGNGYDIVIPGLKLTAVALPRGLSWTFRHKFGVREDGALGGIDGKFEVWPELGKVLKGSVPGATVIGKIPWLAVNGNVYFGKSKEALPPSGLLEAPSHRHFADIDKDGDLDLIQYRYGAEKHTANDIFVYRSLAAKNPDEDADGLTNEQEAALQTDPLDPDTDNDGLLDGWETGVYRDLDLKGLSCNPRRIDLICLISRFSNVDEAHVKRELDRAKKTYAELNVTNPDGSKGFSFHPIYLDPVQEKDHGSPWWANREKFRPAKWKGVVHWMQVSPGGGGQADQMGDGGGCGANALWAVFIHEFGHQIGMDHEGFWQAGLCPIYTSLMNYAYSYSYEDDGNKIHYSNGKFKDYVLDERNLDETLPYPYEEVKFLEKGPYRFRLKPNGSTTLVDWNWNGIFGEKKIKADINYSYSTNAGRRDEIGKIMTSPWLFTHKGTAWAVYGTHKLPGDLKTDPTISKDKPGDLWLRRLEKPFKWAEPMRINLQQKLVGDPVAASKDGAIYIVYPATGLAGGQRPHAGIGLARVAGKTVQEAEIHVDPKHVPTVGMYKNTLYIFLWNPDTGEVTYYTIEKGLQLSDEKRLLRRSTIPVGMAADTIRDDILIGAAEDQDKNRPTRWQIRRMKEIGGRVLEKSVEWIEGEAGGSRGYGRATVLFDGSKEAGKDGRIYFYGRGMTSKEAPWACTYVAHQIADKSVRGGWLVKRFYDEWTQSRSAPAAAWFNGDIIWAYRWVDGSQGDRDNLFHVGYRALGIDEQPMGDHDDISFFRDIGIRHSILYLGG